MQSEAGSSLRHSASSLGPLPATHPLSIKLRSVFASTSSFSPDSKANQKALHEIERRYAKPKGASVRKGLHVAIDTEQARISLARDAEDALEEACLGYLDSLQVIDESLSSFTDAINELQTSCSEIEGQLNRADETTKYLLQHADGLRKQMNTTSEHAALLDLFLQRFSLSPEQASAIDSRSEIVGPSLYVAMDRLQEIRRDCQVLLIGQEEGTKGGMRAGMDIMDETSQLLDRALQKIAKWLNFEMRSFFREGIDVGANVREGVRRLENREDLLRPVLKTLTTTRAQQLSSAFQRALTAGGPAPTFLPRPIELHAHDPIRYVGDMLAWVHQSVASEREFLAGLFSRLGNETDMEGGRRVGQRRRGLEGSIDWSKSNDDFSFSKAELWTREVLDKVMDGCDRVLKGRIEQTVKSQEGCITTFRLASLIQFYRVVMDRTIGSKAVLSKTLAEISIFAYQGFLGTLDKLASGLSRFQEPPQADLGPPPPLIGVCGTLKELLSVHQTSLSESDLFGDSLPLKDLKGADEGTDFSRVIDRIVEPLLDLCRRMGGRSGRGKAQVELEWEKHIFMVNCLGYVKSVLEPYDFATACARQVEDELKKETETLVYVHCARLSKESGLAVAATEESSTQKALDSFDAFLSSGALLDSPHLALLHAPARRAMVHTRAMAALASDYEVLGRKEAELLPQGSRLTRRSPDELRILLGIDDKEAVKAEM